MIKGTFYVLLYLRNESDVTAFKNVCSDHFFDTELFPIENEILVSQESPYLSHYPCEILRPKGVLLRWYEQ